ncbi:hypothetical protein NKH18_28050 [Streptomyces sp. M10(2022)]
MNGPGQILRWNLFIGGHLSSSVPVRLVERTAEGQLVWLETGTRCGARPCLAVPTSGTSRRGTARPGLPAKADRWPRAAHSSTSPSGPVTPCSGSSDGSRSSAAGM